MNESLIDGDNFYEEIFHASEYGKAGWPSSTILLYKIRIKRETTKAQKLLHQSGCSSLQCERWIRVDNDSCRGFHAETILIQQVNDLLDCLREDRSLFSVRQISIDIVLSYSPCSNCAKSLIKLKETIENVVFYDRSFIFCDMNVKFANFYQHYRHENIKNLIKMTHSQIQLSVFNGLCDWKDFLDNTVKLSLDVQSEYFYGAWRVRQKR
ncbi:uncharacterized protein LOC123541419 [Mercenaria mercenaria]|uniref:uncharacterized protein LOC123541419 n=1 Tax=Mercenaria mercenaria TaxID=6596 RepID=UPI00234F6EA3|nr:uncharacterized protein LOC123541419 [Mercenaria mercenaria]